MAKLELSGVMPYTVKHFEEKKPIQRDTPFSIKYFEFRKESCHHFVITFAFHLGHHA